MWCEFIELHFESKAHTRTVRHGDRHGDRRGSLWPVRSGHGQPKRRGGCDKQWWRRWRIRFGVPAFAGTYLPVPARELRLSRPRTISRAFLIGI
jgi:hypothetical protein